MRRLAHALDRSYTVVLLFILCAFFLISLVSDGLLRGFEIALFFGGTCLLALLGTWIVFIAVCFAELQEECPSGKELRVSPREIARLIKATKPPPARIT